MAVPTSKRLVAAITGASSGIGRATAILFAEKGYQLSLNGRNEEALAETVKECIAKGVPKESIVMTCGDLRHENVAKQLMETTLEKFHRLDTLINAAGILLTGVVAESSLNDYDTLMDVNVRSVIRLTQLAIPHLIETKGTIVNVSSINGPCPFAGVTFYCMSKAALDQFTKCLSLELGPLGVRVNSVNPGVVITDVHLRSGMSEEDYKAFIDRGKETHPLCRVGQPSEVAEGIYFLASEHSSFITGELLRIDGGRGLKHPR